MPWKKGESGNPGGRKVGIRERVRQLVDMDELVAVCTAIAFDITAENKDRLGAVRELMDRGWGKPHVNVTFDGDIRTEVLDVLAMTPEQRSERTRRLEEKRMLLIGDLSEPVPPNRDIEVIPKTSE